MQRPAIIGFRRTKDEKYVFFLIKDSIFFTLVTQNLNPHQLIKINKTHNPHQKDLNFFMKITHEKIQERQHSKKIKEDNTLNFLNILS